MAKLTMTLLLLIGLILMSSLPKYTVAQLRAMCISQFALANHACVVLPTVESPMDQNNTRISAAVDNDDDDDDGDGDDDDDAEREHRHRRGNGNGHRQRHENGNGHKQRHRNGHGHRQRREHGHGHREEPQAERDCCRWLGEVDEACVCTVLLRLPPFLIKPKHQYSIKVGDTCDRTFKCDGI